MATRLTDKKQRFVIKKSDLRPALRVQCTHGGDNSVVDLTAASVVFYMKTRGATPAIKVNGSACVLIDAANGIVEYRWAGTDTDTVGFYDAEFRVTLPGALPSTFPGDQYIEVEVRARLA